MRCAAPNSVCRPTCPRACPQVAAVNSLGAGADSSLYDTAVAAYKPAVPQQLVATPGANTATLTFAPAAGAVSYEAAILPATGDWRVPTDALAPYAPSTVQPIDGTAKLTFDVPLSAVAYRDGQYKFQVRAVDANGVRGDWSAESGPVTVGECGPSLWGERTGCDVAHVSSLPPSACCHSFWASSA